MDMLDNRLPLHPPDLSAQATLCPHMMMQDEGFGQDEDSSLRTKDGVAYQQPP